jgi:hypothetical protein
VEVKTSSGIGSTKSSNLVSYNSEVLIIWHLRVVPKDQKFCFLPENSFISETVGLRDMFKEVFKNVSTVISPDPLTPTPSTSSAVNTQKAQKRALITLIQQINVICK